MTDGISTAPYRQRLLDGFERLEAMHQKRTPAAQLVAHRVAMVDRILKDAWQEYISESGANSSMTLVAVGGYGREELNPYSDIDLMVLIEQQEFASALTTVQPFIRFLWDTGLEVGHSVRSIGDCIKQARSDITVMTNLLESRFCAGNESLLEQLNHKLRNSTIWPTHKFYMEKLLEQERRHHKYSDTAYNLEPNIKHGPGGLRDIHMISWVAMRYFENRSLHELVTHDFLSEDEYKVLIKSRNYLWKIRNSLHLSFKRREDRLLFPHQIQLAKQFGYLDDNKNQAVEKLMKNYFRTVKEVRHINTMMLQFFNESIISKPKRRIKVVNEQFRTVDDYLDFIHPERISKCPEILIEIFALVQSHREVKGIRASALRHIRSNRTLINQQVRSGTTACELLMRIIGNSTMLPEVLECMNDTGLLGALIPEFGRVVGQMQYDLFHVYTVDAHSLFVVRNLVEINHKDNTNYPELAHSIMKRLVKPERLYIAGLFHDLSKGQGGDHSELGEVQSYKFCKRVGMSEYDAHFVAWLVRYHLIMSFSSQREDLNDSEVISRFATKVGDQEHLDNLYLLTVADMRGTGPTVWNDWKGKMLEHIYMATSRALLMDSPQHDAVESRINEIRMDAQDALNNSQEINNQVAQFWDYLDDEYFLCYDADTIAWHAQTTASSSAVDLPTVSCRKHPTVEVAQTIILAPDFEDLFAIITGVFDRVGVNVVEARIHPLRTGLTAFTFVLLGSENIQWASFQNLKELEKDIRQSIILRKLDHRPPTVHPSRATLHVRVPTIISFTQSPAQSYTMMEVSAADRPGLLYLVARTLHDFRVRLLSAKITTSGQRAEDIFFIVDRDGNSITSPDQQQQLSDRLYSVLENPN